ncbi:hypothetical protein AVEN_96172-1 [Araneus ventricosus]|uniref:Uncharacterized protein n=1 Tax=Araneus ventricosus TaxID=182803 RepID=A0A4Y2V660_ARAVE|nr:hypothetical protein AVEN_90121-1 [Araneus ventricosus]GBO20005.1 hypothetical protein AVEN_108167-1 [Araneus ventricosus]GBO20008.1 hypothetical protein AVEN_193222-1 [Araneus ventricosus]GBO20023.1 hypothetical protein AVEN_96172-1 [Araneus ventricosus]
MEERGPSGRAPSDKTVQDFVGRRNSGIETGGKGDIAAPGATLKEHHEDITLCLCQILKNKSAEGGEIISPAPFTLAASLRGGKIIGCRSFTHLCYAIGC